MKKILIVSHAMELGGAERALIGLLDALDYSRVSVDLFLERHSGELLGAIPKQVRLLPENKAYASMAIPAAQVLKNREFGVALGRFYAKKKAKSFNKKAGYKNGFDVVINYSGKYTAPFMPMISDEEYDLVVSFLTPHYYALKKAHGKVKAAWIHTDYSAVEIDRDAELKMWSGFDKIISISDAVTKSFVKTFPELRNKITVIENMHPP
ncbi:MAG: glycosyltransferase, partial [Acutalibacteraceae bacterium]